MTDKPKVAVLGPQAYMRAGIEALSDEFDVEELHPRAWEEAEIDRLVAQCRESGIEAVAGFAQKDVYHHIALNERLGNAVPSRLALLYCMNKYLMRTLEANPFWYAPISPLEESDEEIEAKIAEWPFMLKNTSLSLGRGIFKINKPEELREVLRAYREDTELQAQIRYQNERIVEGIPADKMPRVVPPFIAEHMVDTNQAVEYCYEGYITPDGKVGHYGITEEVYFRNHHALGYITPPISIGAEQAAAFEAWVDDYMSRLAGLGYRNQFFNLEMWLIDGALHLTEINPRAAHTFHYNYAFSYGCSLYGDNLWLAYNERPPQQTPWQMWLDQSERGVYTLIVLITARQTGRVDSILDYSYVRQLEEEEGVLIRHVRKPEDELTRKDMTAAGAMLLQMWITGRTKQETIARERAIRDRIYIQRSEVFDYPAYWVV
jgi:hypothetical protein